MVVKQRTELARLGLRFENGVISYGGQAHSSHFCISKQFENGVISYGGQAGYERVVTYTTFEKGVISNKRIRI